MVNFLKLLCTISWITCVMTIFVILGYQVYPLIGRDSITASEALLVVIALAILGGVLRQMGDPHGKNS